MCGVIGLIYKTDKQDLGIVASKLLKMLEYRGYDSTGAIFQKEDQSIVLLKDVGAPSKLITKLEIDKQSGKIFCGQVRWATFGVVNKENSQPHHVNCKINAYGAHNGNITNTNQLKTWLINEGHDIKSDNDGEMLVHTLEHFYAQQLKNITSTDSLTQRKKILHAATIKSFKTIEGSFASVFFDPKYEIMCAIKAGSSLYCGIGFDDNGGPFVIVSSDLGAVLYLTKILIPIETNEFIIATHDNIEVFNIHTGKPIKKIPKKTALETGDIQLNPQYKFFMEQEIHTQPQVINKLITIYTGFFENRKIIQNFYQNQTKVINTLKKLIQKINECADSKCLSELYNQIINGQELIKVKHFIQKHSLSFKDTIFISSISSICHDILTTNTKDHNLVDLCKFIDLLFAYDDYKKLNKLLQNFISKVNACFKKGGHLYVIACGTSYHAAKVGAIFFNKIAQKTIYTYLPGEFRSQVLNTLSSQDIVILISQSGETKDLVDIVDLIKKQEPAVHISLIVNNINSTLALEKAHSFWPIFCGVEVAVPATKSFSNQIVLLYIFALEIAKIQKHNKKFIKKYQKILFSIPTLIEQTLNTLENDIDMLANELYLEPSLHILAVGSVGIAQEGALKIREVVLNHTQGYEASEFKHGPNTILGVNTVFGLHSTQAILHKFISVLSNVVNQNPTLAASNLVKIFKACSKYAFEDIYPHNLSEEEQNIFNNIFKEYDFFESMYKNYPLIFVTSNCKQDINLAISQINTHKIRGANIFIFAEHDDALEDAVKSPPKLHYTYKYKFIKLPKTDNTISYIFSSIVALQLLALKMSIKKGQYLDKIEIKDHGVHPDAPKNVSKSITVD